MQLICLSLSHQNAPVELRECLSLSQERIGRTYVQFPPRQAPYEAITELVILSTCNRLELYALVSLPQGSEESPQALLDPVLTYLENALQVPGNSLGAHFRLHSAGQAVRHIFRVASGLESIAVGESQILGQVSRALDSALQSGSARHVLSSVFRAAIHTGKRVRTETEVGRQRTSLSNIGVQLAESRLGDLSSRKVLVIGAGRMGGDALAVLQAKKATQVTLTNRTLAHAQAAAQSAGARVLDYSDLSGGLAEADLVITATSAPVPILRPEQVAQAMQGREDHPMVIVDLAVPRNVDPHVRGIGCVEVYDMDGLQDFAKETGSGSLVELARAQGIVEDEVTEYEKLLRIIPFIGELHKKVEEIRQREVEKALRRLHDPSPEVSLQLELLSRSLVQKVLHEPTMHLRTETNEETLNDYVDTLARLFDLSENVSELANQESL